MIKPQELKFKKFCITIGNLPSSYVESMSYYECLMWLCKYLQDTVIPAVNNNAEALTELQELFIQLHNYVENYFDNLDVQEEIDNKLDEMVEDGSFERIIAEYLKTQKIYDTYEDMIEDSDTLVSGLRVQTLGYHNINDGGGALYLITDTASASDYQIQIGSLYATLLTNNTVNIKQLGAYGDDTHDDTTVIQNALNNFNNIYFPQGTYLLTEVYVQNKDNYNIYGENASNTMLKCTKVSESAFAVVGFNTCENIKLHDLYIHGEKTYLNTPLSFVNCNNVEIYNNILNGGTDQRTLNVQTFSTSYGHNTFIHNNKFYNYGYIKDGALIECTGSHETIEDAEVRYYLTNLIISENYCEVKEATYIGNNDLFDCIEVDNTIGCVIDKNYCDTILHIGISVDTVNIDFRVTNNYCINANTQGINVTGDYGYTQGIVANNIVKTTKQGIAINNENINVVNNQIYDCTVRGIVLLENCKYCSVSDNLIDNAPEGIYLAGLVSECLVSHNQIRRITNSNRAIVVPTGTGNHISLNFDNTNVTIENYARLQCLNGIMYDRVPTTYNTIFTAGSKIRFINKNGVTQEFTTTEVTQ